MKKLNNSVNGAVLALLILACAACQCRPGRSTVAFRPATARGLVTAGGPVTGPSSRLAPTARAEMVRPAPLGSLASVRQPEEVKVYGVNRYIDPADGRVLHERHALYRIEQPSGWVTRQPDHRGEVLLGPVLGLRRAEYRPEPIPGETAQALVQQRRVLQETTTGVQNLQEDQRRLSAGVERLAQQSAEAQQKLTAIVTVLNARLKRLEGEEPEKNEASNTAPALPNAHGTAGRGPE